MDLDNYTQYLALGIDIETLLNDYKETFFKWEYLKTNKCQAWQQDFINEFVLILSSQATPYKVSHSSSTIGSMQELVTRASLDRSVFECKQQIGKLCAEHQYNNGIELKTYKDSNLKKDYYIEPLLSETPLEDALHTPTIECNLSVPRYGIFRYYTNNPTNQDYIALKNYIIRNQEIIQLNIKNIDQINIIGAKVEQDEIGIVKSMKELIEKLPDNCI